MEINIIIMRKGTDSIGNFVAVGLEIDGNLADVIEFDTFLDGFTYYMNCLNNL